MDDRLLTSLVEKDEYYKDKVKLSKFERKLLQGYAEH